WGVWWVWEPRLTTYLVLMLLVIAYFILRVQIDSPERRARIAAVFGIITFIDAPLCLLITRLVPTSIHPVVFRTDSGLPPAMLIPFLVALFGMLLIGFGVYQLRLRQLNLSARLLVLQARYDEINAQND
ncbi:MAG: cytochrome c biogenesis protein CcsA, partial [Coriobacteriia bacterium]|nr:cytochrome c biogenesis protein CcsA [Coriobacteriia bacterium]